MTDHVQTKREVEATLAAGGLRPDRRLGQHFLIDGNLMRKLADSAEIDPGDTVLEVGGGTGGLTDLLHPRAGRVIVVEVSRSLAPILTDRFANAPNVHILHCDVLAGKHHVAPQVIDALVAAAPASGRYLLVANLPYHVATPLIMNLLVAEPRIDRFCFTIQKEVADRLTAKAPSRDFGPLAIACQTVCSLHKIATIPPSAFWPAPKVSSAMLRMDRRSHAFEQAGHLQQFIDLLHAAFAHRRKTLRYNLARFLVDDDLARAAANVDLSLRAEEVPLEHWIELGKLLVLKR